MIFSPVGLPVLFICFLFFAVRTVIKTKTAAKTTGPLFPQAMLVSEELIRVAILWHELWHEGLEEASRLYFGERNIKGVFYGR